MKKSNLISNHSRRLSNFELMRIVLMLAIVAHHYVVNSGVSEFFAADYAANALFLQIWGMWGKAAINAFVLITGYFMCSSRLTWSKVFKLWFEVKLYRLAVFAVLAAAGCQEVTLRELFLALFGIAHGVGGGFASSFIVFYLLIPFLNRLFMELDGSLLDRLLVLLLGIFVVTVTFFGSAAFNEVGWYATLYLLAARIRLRPSRLTEDPRLSGVFFLGSIALSIATVVSLSLLGMHLIGNPGYAYWFMVDSSKLMAFLLGFSCFLFFKNLRVPYSPSINRVASTVFGVLLIHASSDVMREFLWVRILGIPGMYDSALPLLALHAALSMLGVFIACSLIDLARQVLVERPLMDWVYAHREGVESHARSLAGSTVARLEPMLSLQAHRLTPRGLVHRPGFMSIANGDASWVC